MRSGYLTAFGFALILLVMIGTGRKTHAWEGWEPIIMIQHAEPVTGEITQMVLDIGTYNPAQAADVKSIRAWNTDSEIDPTIYNDWYLWNSVRKTRTTYEFIIESDYEPTLHYGAYYVEVKYNDNSTEIFSTPSINQWSDPFPPPAGLEVDYSSGITTPTFRFMPVDDPRIDYYSLRVRYYEGPNQVQMTYRTINIGSWDSGVPIEVIYLDENMSDYQGTEEPLQPGIEYHVRVEAHDADGASSGPAWRAFFRSEDRLYFSLDQDGDGILDLVDTEPYNPLNEDFADAATTSGEIVSRGNQSLIIANQPDPEGVRIIASITGDDPPAMVRACGGTANYTLNAGDQMIVTCGSVETKILYGTVEITFVGDDGTPATTSLDAGNGLAFEPATFTFSAPPTNSDVIVVIVEDEEFSIVPGGKIVEIDIKPGSYPNSINLGSHGVVPVAILSSGIFDVTTVNPDTVELAGAGVAVRGKGNKFMAHKEDVNNDGLIDLVVQIETQNLDPTKFQDGYAVLKAETYDGWGIEGEDEITIVPN